MGSRPPEASDVELDMTEMAVDRVISELPTGVVENPTAADVLLELSGIDSNAHNSNGHHPNGTNGHDNVVYIRRGQREPPVSSRDEWDDDVSLRGLTRFREKMRYDTIRQPTELHEQPLEMPDEDTADEEELSEYFLRDLLKSVKLLSINAAPDTKLPPALTVNTGEQIMHYWVEGQKPEDLSAQILRELPLVTAGFARETRGLARLRADTKTLVQRGQLPKPLGFIPHGNKMIAVWSKWQLTPRRKSGPIETLARDDKEDHSWRAQAACSGSLATGIFFPESGQATRLAKSVCKTCSVRQDCLEAGLRNTELRGIWGGTSEKERRIIRRRRRVAATRAELRANLAYELFDESGELEALTLIHPPNPDVQALIGENPALEPIAVGFESAGLDVRDDQILTTYAVEQAMEAGQERILYQMYPGGGKTNVAAILADRWLAENPGKRVLYLCHDTRILRQARERFANVLGHDEYTYGTFTGAEKDWDEPTFLFGSFQTMQQINWQEHFENQEFDLVIVDESHHSKAATYEAVLEHFLPRADLAIAMSGTIKRHDMRDIQEIWGAPVISKTFAEALDEDRLVQPEYYIMSDPYEEQVLEEEGILPHQLNKRIYVEELDKKLIAAAQKQIKAFEVKHGVKAKTLIFDSSIAHADITARLWPTDARALHSNSRNTLKAFKHTEFSTLVTVDMLNEGIDIVDVNVIVFLGGTLSEPKFIQRLARGLRKAPGKHACLVLDFANNYQNIMMDDPIIKDIPVQLPAPPKPQPGEQSGPSALEPVSINVEKIEYSPIRVDFVNRVKILDKDPMPKGAVSLNRYAKERHRDFRTIVKYMRTLHMVPLSLPYKKSSYWIPKEYAQELDTQVDLIIDLAEPDEMRLPKAAEELGIGISVAGNALEDLEIRLPTKIFDDGAPPGLAINKETLALLEASPRVQNYKEGAAAAADYQPLADDEESINMGARSLNVTKEIFLVALEDELGMTNDSLLKRITPKGNYCRAVKKAHTAWIAHSKTIEEAQPAPKGALSVHRLATELGTADKTLVAKAKELGIEPKRRKGYRNHYDMFFAEDLEPIRSHPYFSGGGSKYRGRTARKGESAA
jgi:superfamily II DNA or RNA helicase